MPTGSTSGSGRAQAQSQHPTRAPAPPLFLPTAPPQRADVNKGRMLKGKSLNAPDPSRTAEWLGRLDTNSRPKNFARTRDVVETVESWTQRRAEQSSDQEALDIDDREAVRPRGQKRAHADYDDRDLTEEGSEWHGISGAEEQTTDGDIEEEYLLLRE